MRDEKIFIEKKNTSVLLFLGLSPKNVHVAICFLGNSDYKDEDSDDDGAVIRLLVPRSKCFFYFADA